MSSVTIMPARKAAVTAGKTGLPIVVSRASLEIITKEITIQDRSAAEAPNRLNLVQKLPINARTTKSPDITVDIIDVMYSMILLDSSTSNCAAIIINARPTREVSDRVPIFLSYYGQNIQKYRAVISLPQQQYQSRCLTWWRTNRQRVQRYPGIVAALLQRDMEQHRKAVPAPAPRQRLPYL